MDESHVARIFTITTHEFTKEKERNGKERETCMHCKRRLLLILLLGD